MTRHRTVPSYRRRSSVERVAAALALVLTCGAVDAASRGGLIERLRSSLAEADRERDDGHLEPAAALYRQVRDQATALGTTNLPLARAIDGLADVLRLAGRPAEAAPLYRHSARLWELLLGDRQPRLAVTLHHLGTVRLALGQPDLALPPLRRALGIWRETLGPDAPETRNTEKVLRAAERGRAWRDPPSPTGSGRDGG